MIGAERKLTQPKTQRRDRAQERDSIPRPDAADAVAIYDGQQIVGTCVKRDDSFFSFGADRILIGEYRTLHEAVRALPQVRR